MKMLPEGVRRFFRFGRSKDVAAEVDAELAFHLDTKTQALIARGMSADDARAEALRQLGDLREVRRELLAADRGAVERRARVEWWSDWWLDVRYAARGLARTPGITVAIVAMLALGIGLNAAMMGILDRLILRAPPHLRDPGRLVRVAVTLRAPGVPTSTRTLAPYLEIVDYTRDVPAFEAVAGYTLPWSAFASSPSDTGAERVKLSSVTAAYFRVLGASALLGRTLDSSYASGPPVAVISYGFMRRRFGDGAHALGQSVRAMGRSFTVVGVMPNGFSGVEADAADMWTLLADWGGNAPEDWRTNRNSYFLEVVARLRPGATSADALVQVERSLRAMEPARRVAHVMAGTEAQLISIVPGRKPISPSSDVPLTAAVAIVGILLLFIAVANVGNLLLVRAIARLREFAVRTALGAGRRRLIRLILTESLLLAVGGGLMAGGVAAVGGRLLRAELLPKYSWAEPPLGVSALVFGALLTLGVGVAAGIVPAILAGRDDVLASLRAGIQRERGSRSRVRAGLVALQAAVSLALVAGSGLFIRSLAAANEQDFGLDLRHLTAALSLGADGNADAKRAKMEEIMAAVRRVPGAIGVTVTTAAPLYRLDFTSIHTETGDSARIAIKTLVGANYFSVTGLPVVGGRAFTDSDRLGAEPVAIVDRRMATTLWLGRPAVGQCVRLGNAPGCVRVVGVCESARTGGFRDSSEPQIYLPVAQAETMTPEFALLIRAKGDPALLREPVGAAIRQSRTWYNPSQVISYTLRLDPLLRPWRIGARLFAVAATLATLLSAVGLYAVLAFAVRQRTHEFGVRRALGARARHIVRLILSDGLMMAGSGLVIGLGFALWGSRQLAPLLYHVGPHDSIAFVSACLVLLAITICAGLLASLAAVRSDPRQALQAD